MDGFGNKFFAGAAFALNQHGRTARRDLCDEIEEAQHRLALADDVFEVVALLKGALELDDLFFGTMPSDSAANIGEELLVIPGLLDEVLCARTYGVYDVADGAEGGDQDDRELWLYLQDAWQ